MLDSFQFIREPYSTKNCRSHVRTYIPSYFSNLFQRAVINHIFCDEFSRASSFTSIIRIRSNSTPRKVQVSFNTDDGMNILLYILCYIYTYYSIYLKIVFINAIAIAYDTLCKSHSSVLSIGVEQTLPTCTKEQVLEVLHKTSSPVESKKTDVYIGKATYRDIGKIIPKIASLIHPYLALGAR